MNRSNQFKQKYQNTCLSNCWVEKNNIAKGDIASKSPFGKTFTLMMNLTIGKTYNKCNLLGLKLEILYLFKAETTGMLLKFFGIIMSLKL